MGWQQIKVNDAQIMLTLLILNLSMRPCNTLVNLVDILKSINKERETQYLFGRAAFLNSLWSIGRRSVPYHKKDKRRPIIIWFPKNCTNICHANDFFQTMLKKMCNKRYHWNRIANYCNKRLKTLVSLLLWKV